MILAIELNWQLIISHTDFLTVQFFCNNMCMRLYSHVAAINEKRHKIEACIVNDMRMTHASLYIM